MTEKEKMLSGKFNNSRDPQLIERYHIARNLMAKINGYPQIDLTEKLDLFSKLLGNLGENVWIETPFYCDYGELVFYKRKDNECIVHGIYIFPEYRQQGFCRDILHYLIDQSR